jgi:outer membrane receptor protein involved in Fe transport
MKHLRDPLVLVLLLLLPAIVFPAIVRAQTPDCVVTGVIKDEASHAPLERANVVLLDQDDPSKVLRTMAGKDGAFAFAHVPPGSYIVECSFIGHKSFRSPAFVLSEAHRQMDLQIITLQQSIFALDEVVITSEKNIFKNTIDRKVYNINRDIMAKSSTASDILQNIPSVQVDIDGNVSLRGSPDVMVLINGKPSPLMGRSRADVLQQLPAGSIEKIEVITNPSARFTPEGTSGIINIVMKKGAASGANGNATGHFGSTGRHNESLDLNYNPGKVNLFGSYSYREDRRSRTGKDARGPASSSIPVRTYRADDRFTMRPRVHIANLGMSYRPGPANSLELTGEYFSRRPRYTGISTILSGESNGVILQDYDRIETGTESESETGATATFQHNFPKEDHELRVEANAYYAPETERTHYADVYRIPAGPIQESNTLLRQDEDQGRLSVDYTNPLNGRSKLEAGYALDLSGQDIRSDADTFDPARLQLIPDTARIYRFKLDQAVHALYGTYQRSVGRINVLGGLRTEQAIVKSDLVSNAVQITNRYSGIYPTLHLAYNVSEGRQFQLNYSRRINRPESDELNPFPEYADPYNMEAGNPHLKPESIHSIELGFQRQGERFSFTPSIYYRYKRDGFTRVTQAVSDSTFLRTVMNLASDQSAGFEPVLTVSLGGLLKANLNGNIFYDQIDASNIGYSSKKSVFSWSGTFNASISPVKTTMFQVSSNYRSARLTPQGDSRPSFVLNLGARQDLFREQISVTLAVSDLLKTQRQEMNLNVAGVNQHATYRRDSQIVFAGVTYHYGRAEKKAKGKDKSIQFEEQ